MISRPRENNDEYGIKGGGNSLYLRAPNGQGYIKSPSLERITSIGLGPASSPLKTAFSLNIESPTK
jgi:hypothetical protein